MKRLVKIEMVKSAKIVPGDTYIMCIYVINSIK